MNYYIIPKNNCVINILPQFSQNPIKPIISYSLLFYLDDIAKQMSAIPSEESEEIKRFVNPLEFVQTPVPFSSFSVSKIKASNNIFYELMEIIQICGLMDNIVEPLNITTCHIGPNHTSTLYLMDMLREDKEDNIVAMDFDRSAIIDSLLLHDHDNAEMTNKFDLLIIEWSEHEYNNVAINVRNMILSFMVVARTQKQSGLAIIKIDNLVYKPILDVIFLLSSLYDKISIVKPTNSNILKGERYIVCNGFCKNINIDNIITIGQQIDNTLLRIVQPQDQDQNQIREQNIVSILDQELPYYFVNRIEEPNAIIGQQQLEAFDHVINIYKNKNKDEKLETLKRNHIQKCVQWCEKNQIPHNKFADKVNIFLLPKKRENDMISTTSHSSNSSSSEEEI